MGFVFFIILCMCMLTSCTTSLEKQIWNNISEIREFILFEKMEGMSVSLICGQRENDYKMNGYVTKLIPFGVITVTIESIDSIVTTESRYVLYVGTEKFEGNLIRNPFDDTFVADIGKVIDKTKNVSIDVFINNSKTSMKLRSVDSEWKVSSKDCVEILLDHYKNQLKSFIGEEFEGEVYIKIMNDYDQFSSDFYYYVSVIGRKGSSISLIISTDGKVLASNANIVPNIS